MRCTDRIVCQIAVVFVVCFHELPGRSDTTEWVDQQWKSVYAVYGLFRRSDTGHLSPVVVVIWIPALTSMFSFG